jgi:pimeloyl-ACP methyl ester carboxylesterase
MLAGCAAPAEPSPGPSPTEPDAEQVDGTFDVGGYSLYLKCEGTGSPTVVYFHGSDFEPGDAGSHSAASLPARVRETHRFCAYDRVNVGKSDDRPEIVSGAEAVRALDALLTAARVEPPYVLLGASFGGLIAYEYLRTHPDQVEGMLLLDAAFPDELALERFFPTEDKLENVDWSESEEKLDQFAVYEETTALRGGEPDIPVTYLRATPPVTWTLGIPEYDAVVLDAQAEYVESFPRGVLKEVESPHYMEAAVPERIVDELDEILGQIEE